MPDLFTPYTATPPRPASPALHRRVRTRGAASEDNKLRPGDRPIHDWYRFVLSYPPHLVRRYLERFEVRRGHRVLDPFCGTGTTITECKKRDISSVGIEANPMACLASRVKADWSVDPDALVAEAERIATAASDQLSIDGVADQPVFVEQQPRTGLRTLPPPQMKLLLKDSISPLPLHKALVLRDQLDGVDEAYRPFLQVALAKALVFSSSNLHFGPEVGVTQP